jgi:CheY-like chemotaxis protein
MQEKNTGCGQRTALVVDDDEICRCVTAEILDNLGMLVHLAPDAEHALSLAKTNCYDLLLLDLYMPDMNGLELAARLLEKGLTTQDRILLLTGEESDTAVKKMHAGLALPTIRKPLDRARIESFFSGGPSPAPSAEAVDHNAVRIEGFDIPRALANFMGYESAYFNILREFPEYGDKFISEYASHLRTANLKECRRLAHSIKGSSLMIGAMELNILASELETACLISPETQHVEKAFKAIEEKILAASKNVKKHFQSIDNA